MWTTFWPDLLIGVLGAVLTVAIAVVSYRVQQRLANKQLVRNLADDLAMRRAFEEITPSVSSLESVDGQRCLSSLRSAQQQISAVRDQIAPDHQLRAVLQEMVAWSREFKNLTDENPYQWQIALMDVRAELVSRLRRIERLMRLKKRLPDPGTARVERRGPHASGMFHGNTI
jgi:hypothetical protein